MGKILMIVCFVLSCAFSATGAMAQDDEGGAGVTGHSNNAPDPGAEINGQLNSAKEMGAVLLAKTNVNIGAGNYGNYCGEGWSNGKWEKDFESDLCKIGAAIQSPTDEMDALCFEHDRAYCSRDEAVKDHADQALIDGLKSLKPVLQQQLKDAGCDGVKPPEVKPTGYMAYLAAIKARLAALKARLMKTPVGDPGGQAARESLCARLKSQMVYNDATIAALTAKRELYKRGITKNTVLGKLKGVANNVAGKITGLKSPDKSGAGDQPGGTAEPFRW
jgi:hypothetical protein